MNHRFSLDLPEERHMAIKMRATMKGISMREYIIEALDFKERSESCDMDEATFKDGLNKLIQERSQLAKNLSKR
jgi:hypothetical protein